MLSLGGSPASWTKAWKFQPPLTTRRSQLIRIWLRAYERTP
jgi:hypothetical protein